jgi:hypothetical protein
MQNGDMLLVTERQWLFRLRMRCGIGGNEQRRSGGMFAEHAPRE